MRGQAPHRFSDDAVLQNGLYATLSNLCAVATAPSHSFAEGGEIGDDITTQLCKGR